MKMKAIPKRKDKVLLIYTGGTIGMGKNPLTGALEPLNFNHLHAFSTGWVSSDHTHYIPDHTHSVSGGKVTDASAANATSAHSTVQRYKNIYIWERTA